jgi:ribonucleoside-diphosphate reductase beta chain
MSKVFHTICAENPGALDAQLIEHIVSAVSEALELEEHFIDLAFALGDVEGLTPESVKEYLIYLANKRLHDLGLTHRFTKYLSNPFPWMDELLGGTEHTNFFENRPTSYSKVNYVGSWDEVWSAYGGHS